MQTPQPDPDFDWTSGYPASHLSFIYNEIVPQRYISGDVVKEAMHSAHEDNKEILVEDENIAVELLGGPFEGYLIPIHNYRFEGTVLDMNKYQTYVTYKKSVGYALEKETKQGHKDETVNKNGSDIEECNNKEKEKIEGTPTVLVYDRLNENEESTKETEPAKNGSHNEECNNKEKKKIEGTPTVLVYDRLNEKEETTKETEPANFSDTVEIKPLKQKEGGVLHDFVLDAANTKHGYFKVKVVNPDDVIDLTSGEDNGTSYLSIKAIQKKMHRYLNESVQDPRNRKTRLLQKEGVTNREYVSSDDSCVKKENQEPKVSPVIPDFDAQKMIVALPMTCWPIEATKWLDRPRRSGWPDSDTIQEVSTEVVMVIPCKDNEWNFSFVKAEMILFNKLNKVQRQCFVLLNILRQQSLIFPNILTEDHIKTMFLWTCEKIPQEEWTFENFGTFFVYLIDYMLECIINEEIPHYFMPQCNLLINLAEDFQEGLMTTIANLRTSPVEPFYTYLDFHQFKHLPNKPLGKVFEIIEEEKAFDTLIRIIQKQHKCLENLTKELVIDGKLEVALDLQTDVNELLKSINQTDTQGELLSNIALQVDTDQSIALYEIILQKFPDSPHKYANLGNLACMYHSKYATASDESSSTEFREKTESTFQQAICTAGASSATKADYCNFLFNTDQYDDVLALTTDIIQEDCLKKNPERMDGNSYGGGEKNTVDNNVQSMIDASGEDVSLMSCMYAYYLKVQTFKNLGKLEDARTTLSEFSGACQNIAAKHQQYHETSFMLLGFACKDLEEYDQARKAFRSVEKVNKSNNLATNTKDECMAILLSLNPEFCVESESEEESDESGSDPEISADLLKALAHFATQVAPDDHQTNGQQAVTLHRQYAIIKDEREKAELKEKTQAQFNKALADKDVALTTKMAYANFLYQIDKYEQAIEVLDAILKDQSEKDTKKLLDICYTVQDLAIIDSNIQEYITESEGEAQYLVYIYAFYIMIKCFQHLKKTIKATEFLPQLKRECDRVAASADKKHVASAFSLLGYAARDLEDYDLAIASFDKVLELQPDNLNAKQNRELCEGTKLSKEIFESESGTAEDPSEGSTGNQESISISGMLQDAVKKMLQTPQEIKAEKEKDLDLD